MGKTRHFQGVMTLKESTVVVRVGGSGRRENGEESRGRVMRDLLCHAEKCKLYPVGKESKGSRVKQCYSKYGPQISASQHVACSHSVISTGTKGVNVYKL